MSVTAKDDLTARAEAALDDDFLRAAVRFTTERLRSRKVESANALGHWEEWREQGRQIRTHTIAHLDYYLDLFVTNLEQAGGKAYFAHTGEEAAAIALSIAKEKEARLVAKSKSMVSEEVHINHRFAAEGIDCVETDLGEYIVQLAEETPSHIIIPAIHKNRHQIAELFTRVGGEPLLPETSVLAGFARRKLRQTFLQAEVGMTGCNFAIAETGSIVLFSNEGNARMCSTVPKTHIVTMGMERIIPSLDDLEVMANLLPRSGTGQKLTVYMSALTGPKRVDESDGPHELHVIILDNGRSNQLGDAEFQDVLNCIRCGACLNVCPVYRQIGGHAYGSVYSGPIGAVLTPLLNKDDPQWQELSYASSLCGACYEACPVKIPLHDMLVHLRRRKVEQGHTPMVERLAFRAFARTFGKASRYRVAMRMAKSLQRRTIGEGKQMGILGKLMGPATGWTDHRLLPKPEGDTFRDRWSRVSTEQAGKRFAAPSSALECSVSSVENGLQRDISSDHEKPVDRRTKSGGAGEE